VIPPALEDAMSRAAQAERERHARNILGLAEVEISEKFQLASRTYQNNPVALQLRAMNLLYEAVKERGSMVIVPSSAVDILDSAVLLAPHLSPARSPSSTGIPAGGVLSDDQQIRRHPHAHDGEEHGQGNTRCGRPAL